MKTPLPFIKHLYVMHIKHRNGPLKCLKIEISRFKFEIDSIGHPKELKLNRHTLDFNNNSPRITTAECPSHNFPNELSQNLISNCVNINKNCEVIADALSGETDSLIAQPLPTKILETDFNEIREEMHSIESTYELSLHYTVNSVCSLMLLNTNDLLVLSEDGSFHSMRRMNTNTWSHLKAKLPIKYGSNEKEYLACKMIDACIDSKGQVYVLSILTSLSSQEIQFNVWIFQDSYINIKRTISIC
jgi:hypothetical protein